MSKLLAIDGNSIMSRAFYGIRPLTAPNGFPTNAIYGFISMVDKMRNELNPDAIVVAFDLHEPTFRHQEYSDYKAGRTSTPDEFHLQLALFKEILVELDTPVLTQSGFEADDILGTLSAMCEKENIECCIYTGDKDSFQLISDTTTIYLPKTTTSGTQTILYDKQRIADEFNGLTPKQMIDLKALQGDKSDNIPGVRGIGPKTAVQLISQCSSVENLYTMLDNNTLNATDKVKTLLSDGRDDAMFSKFLGTIRTDVPLDIDIAELSMPNPDPSVVYENMSMLGFNRFINEWGVQFAEIDER